MLIVIVCLVVYHKEGLVLVGTHTPSVRISSS